MIHKDTHYICCIFSLHFIIMRIRILTYRTCYIPIYILAELQ